MPDFILDPSFYDIAWDRLPERFLESLDEDPELKDVLYCTSERLDDKFKTLRDNDSRLEQWLLELLMGPIINADKT